MSVDIGRFSLNKDIKLSCNALKIIACICMLIDHVGYGIVHAYLLAHKMDLDPEVYVRLGTVYEVMKGIGRIAFPIFAFFVVEGFMRTRSVLRYALRLAIFSAISELPFDLGLFDTFIKEDHQNILLTFLIAILMLSLIRYTEEKIPGLSIFVRCLVIVCIVAAFSELSVLLSTDYSWKCMLLTAVLYLARSTGPFRLIAGAAAVSWEKYAPASFVLLYFYDPSVKPRFKYAFYAFYPLHLTVIGLIGYFIIGY